MKIKRITCIQLGGEYPDFCDRLVMPDYGMPLIGTILSQAGFDVMVYMEHIARPEWDRIAQSDLVCFSTLSAGADKTRRLALEIRSKLGIPIIVGGTHASYFPESSLEYGDYIVFGEGDETILELIATLAAGGEVKNVTGIAYREGKQVHRTAARLGPARFDTVPDFSLIKGYRRLSLLDKIVKRKIPLLTVQSSRGCQFKCTFCIVNTMFPSGYRKRDIESVIRDLRDKRRYGNELIFVDNDFAALRPHTKQLLRRMIDEDLGFDVLVLTRVEVARDDELLSLMRQAGVTQIYQGYESVQPETLIGYDKHQTLDVIVNAIEKLHHFGFRISGSFVVGADTDSLETIQRTVAFVLEQQLTVAYFFPVWGHYPEQIHGYKAIVPWYRSIFRGWRYCDGNFVTHYPLRMRPTELQLALINAHRTIFSPIEVSKAIMRGNFADAKEKIAHRYMWSVIEKGMRDYIPFLEELENGLYDSIGNLQEDLLIERVRRDRRWTFQEGNRSLETLGLSPLQLPIQRERNITCVPPKSASNEVNMEHELASHVEKN
jgi:anaerobic magnesium-protoporphyrin IX monomethyl ester cyclase